jgi:opacity protein-like surface antigen
MKKFLMAAAAVASIACAAPAAQAATVTFNQINSADLIFFGAEDFGATFVKQVGDVLPLGFSHVFNFTLDNSYLSSTGVQTTLIGTKDIDFTSIFLDGYAFTQVGFDPQKEDWQLLGQVLSVGAHTLTINGKVQGFGATSGATYNGTIQIAGVPEPTTWALMIGGFGAAGAMLRRKRTLALA